MEGLLEEMCLKLSSIVSDLLGISARRIPVALAEGETDPNKLAAMAEPELRATPEQLRDALRAAPTIDPATAAVKTQGDCLSSAISPPHLWSRS
ncbi:MAG: hypothetical protein JO307_09365 [Bryobacterales bacterium]|nr:hypothetical protein [Bryobacterales bacterium]MBV9397933.1 hypothetical protein [Bryobacterales bacterium]